MATNPASSLKPGQKILALVDESHLLAAARAMNKSIDWLAVREYLLDEGESPDNQGEIVVYVGFPPIFVPEFQELRARKLRFVHWLRIHGFLVMTKDGVPSGDNHYKADVDLLMAVDAMDLVQQIKPDTVVLLTGDPDFAHLGLSLRRKGVRVEVNSAPALAPFSTSSPFCSVLTPSAPMVPHAAKAVALVGITPLAMGK